MPSFPPPILLPHPMKPAINFALHCCHSSQNLHQMMQIPKNNASFICSNKTKRGLGSCPKANKKYGFPEGNSYFFVQMDIHLPCLQVPVHIYSQDRFSAILSLNERTCTPLSQHAGSFLIAFFRPWGYWASFRFFISRMQPAADTAVTASHKPIRLSSPVLGIFRFTMVSPLYAQVASLSSP